MDKLRALQAKKAAAAAPKEEPKTEEASNGTTAAPAQQGSLFSLKKGNKTGAKKQNAAQLRAQKDIGEMDPVPGTKVIFPDPDNIMKFEVNVTPSDGLYRGATFNFQIEIPTTYPYDPPKALCTTLVYHPNIDWEGRVCLNILRQEWMPVLSLGSVIFGLMTLFLEPNPDDPLNKEAAQLMVDRPKDFQRNVSDSLRGGYVCGRKFPQLL
eukprot:TRINITY_DN845_c0_g1_i1.p1 TRINITY_DN845_c0_g1~~TRINITY_DN845_c0_g1_i1.p1  ORF type:complete len:210 (-),score=69.35 TRINITY_DN845_c0_g1_i1:65-694(-)